MKAAKFYVKLSWVVAVVALSFATVKSIRAATDLSADAGEATPAQSIFGAPNQASPLYASGLEKKVNFGQGSAIPISTPVPGVDFDLTLGQIGPDVLRVPAPEPEMYAAAISVCALLSLIGVRRFRHS